MSGSTPPAPPSGPRRRRAVRQARPVDPHAASPVGSGAAVPRGPDLRLLPRRHSGGDPRAAHAGAGATHPAGRGRAPSGSVRTAHLHASVPGGAHVRRPGRRPRVRVRRQAHRHVPLVSAAVGRGGGRGRSRPARAGHRPRRPHVRVRVRGRGRRHRPDVRSRPPSPCLLGARGVPRPDRAGPDPGLAGRQDVGGVGRPPAELARRRAPRLQPGAASPLVPADAHAAAHRRLAAGALHPGRDGGPVRGRARALRELRGIRRGGARARPAAPGSSRGPPGHRPEHRALRARPAPDPGAPLRPLRAVRSRPDPLRPVPRRGGRGGGGRGDRRLLRARTRAAAGARAAGHGRGASSRDGPGPRRASTAASGRSRAGGSGSSRARSVPCASGTPCGSPASASCRRDPT